MQYPAQRTLHSSTLFKGAVGSTLTKSWLVSMELQCRRFGLNAVDSCKIFLKLHIHYRRYGSSFTVIIFQKAARLTQHHTRSCYTALSARRLCITSLEGVHYITRRCVKRDAFQPPLGSVQTGIPYMYTSLNLLVTYLL